MIEISSVLNRKNASNANSALMKRYLLFIIPLGLLFVALGIGILCATRDEKWVESAVAFIVLGAAIPALFVAITVAMIKRRVRTNKMISGSLTQFYRFGENRIYIEESSDTMRFNAEYSYELIYKSIETADNLYLYINNMSALVISKDNFTSGSADELSELLKQKLGKRFSSYKGSRKKLAPGKNGAQTGSKSVIVKDSETRNSGDETVAEKNRLDRTSVENDSPSGKSDCFEKAADKVNEAGFDAEDKIPEMQSKGKESFVKGGVNTVQNVKAKKNDGERDPFDEF